jgi:hypothetical protein
MTLVINQAVLIHFESKKPILCSVKNNNVDNFFSVELLNEVALNISKGDPIVIGLLVNDKIEALGGSVVNIILHDEMVSSLIIVADKKSVPVERRKHVRIPISIYGVISVDNMVVAEACIKDISSSGIRVYTHTEFNTGELFEIDLLLLNEIVHFKCSIVRKSHRYHKNEYGLKIEHDNDSIELMNKFIELICDNHKTLISSLLQCNS